MSLSNSPGKTTAPAPWRSSSTISQGLVRILVEPAHPLPPATATRRRRGSRLLQALAILLSWIDRGRPRRCNWAARPRRRSDRVKGIPDLEGERDERTSPSDRRTTAKEVAEAAGVSISAVSRTFTKGASVSPATREKVLAATRVLGYQPNLLARALMTKRTELIGLISNNFDNPAFMEIFDLFTRRLQQLGRRPLLVNLSGGMESAAALDMLIQYNVDGVIIASSTLPRQFAETCAEARLPVVQAFGRPGATASVHVVGADNVQGGRLGGRLLAERGYRKARLPRRPEYGDLDRGQAAGIPPRPEEERPRAGRGRVRLKLFPPGRRRADARSCSTRTSTPSSAATTSSRWARSTPAVMAGCGSRKTSGSSASTISRWPPGRHTV